MLPWTKKFFWGFLLISGGGVLLLLTPLPTVKAFLNSPRFYLHQQSKVKITNRGQAFLGLSSRPPYPLEIFFKDQPGHINTVTQVTDVAQLLEQELLKACRLQFTKFYHHLQYDQIFQAHRPYNALQVGALFRQQHIIPAVVNKMGTLTQKFWQLDLRPEVETTHDIRFQALINGQLKRFTTTKNLVLESGGGRWHLKMVTAQGQSETVDYLLFDQDINYVTLPPTINTTQTKITSWQNRTTNKIMKKKTFNLLNQKELIESAIIVEKQTALTGLIKIYDDIEHHQLLKTWQINFHHYNPLERVAVAS